jgi:LuxR family maltose regulon positive regulatory protein
VVERRRLLERLDAGLEAGAVRIEAAAGSGKTTLIANWLEMLPHNVHSNWLTLRPEHNDPIRLADDLIALLPGSVDRRASSGTLGEALAALIESTPAPMVLVLDDMHVIHAQSVVHDITSLLCRIPSGMCLVVSGRQDPGLPWATLRERRAMVDVDDADLRFDDEETSRLLAIAFGIDSRDRRVASAVAAAEGWAAALVLTGVTLQAQPDLPIEVSVSPRHRHFIDDFIEDSVLATCTDDVRDFLQVTSILPILEPTLCDLLTGRQDSLEVLRSLVNRNMLTDELAGPTPTFRYHALLRRSLRERLGTVDPYHRGDRVDRVVQELAQQGRLVEATDLALQAGPTEDAEKWIRQACPSATTQGYSATVVRWLSNLPTEQLQSQPDLLLVLARASGLTGDVLTAKAAVRRVRRMIEDNEASPGVRIGLQMMDTGVKLWEGALAESIASLRELLPLVPERVEDPTLDLLGLTRGSILAPLSAGLLMQGHLDEAVEVANEAIGIDELAPLTRHAVLALGVRPLARAWAGRAEDALACLEEAMLRVSTWKTEASEAILFWSAAAWVGPPTEAERNLALAQHLTSRTSIPLLKALPAVTELHVRQRLDQYDRLDEAARKAEEALARAPEPGYLADVLRHELDQIQLNAGAPPGLTDQEIAILAAIASGRSRKEVAEQLHYSVNTVKTYLRSTYRKLGASERDEAVTRARAWGLLK